MLLFAICLITIKSAQAQDLVLPDSVLKIQDLNTTEIGFVIPLKAGQYFYNLHYNIVPEMDTLIAQLQEKSQLSDVLLENERMKYAALEEIRMNLQTQVDTSDAYINQLRSLLDDTNEARHRVMRWNKFWKSGAIIFAATTGVLIATR